MPLESVCVDAVGHLVAVWNVIVPVIGGTLDTQTECLHVVTFTDELPAELTTLFGLLAGADLTESSDTHAY
ncbi:MAG: hypothetical protein ACI8TL_000065 [Natronomonas sp.]